MRADDIVYSLCLLSCIGAGVYVKRRKAEKSYFTLLGCLIAIIVLRFQCLHFFISAFCGTATVIYVHPSKCHLATFILMFGYLFLFRLGYIMGLSEPTGYANIMQMMLTLKLVGLAMERTNAWRELQKHKRQIGDHTSMLTEIDYFDIEIQLITQTDALHYCLNYIGILIGPYYRYRTYRDYFEYPFKDYARCKDESRMKLQESLCYYLLYLVMNYGWPLEYALSEEFYEQHSIYYRILYVVPIFLVFRLRIYAGLTLSECACSIVGFGAYPIECNARSGQGPTIREYDHMKRDADKREYNFETISNMDVQNYEFCWTSRESARCWNKCIQYWLAMNVHKEFPIKPLKTLMTFVFCALWHGFKVGHYFCLAASPFCIFLEDIWDDLIRKDLKGRKRFAVNIIFWLAKVFTISYLVTGFALASYENIMKFYGSIYHIGYIIWFVLFVFGIIGKILKKLLTRKNKEISRKESVEDRMQSADHNRKLL